LAIIESVFPSWSQYGINVYNKMQEKIWIEYNSLNEKDEMIFLEYKEGDSGDPYGFIIFHLVGPNLG
jgi:hypothetical protein